MASKKTTIASLELEVEEATQGLEIDLDVDMDLDHALETHAPLKSLELEVDDDENDPAFAIHSPQVLNSLEGLIVDIDDNVEYLTWLIYGKNGTGKTTLLSTVEGMLVLAVEDGTLSIKDKAKGKAKKIRVDHWDVFEQVYWLLKNGKHTANGIVLNTATGPFLVKSIGIDTVTKLIEVCMRSVVLGSRAKDPTQDLIKKTLKNWGDVSEKVKYWLQMYSELPIQNVWLFQESANSESTDSDEYSIFPTANQSVRLYAMAEADVIARTAIIKKDGQQYFALSAKPNSSFVTKDRTNSLKIMANPSLDIIYAKAFGKSI